MTSTILDLLRRSSPIDLGEAVIKKQTPEPWMLQVAAGDEHLTLRQPVSVIELQVNRNQVQVSGFVLGEHLRRVEIAPRSEGYANQVEAAIAFQRIAAEYVGKGYTAVPEGPLGRRVLDNQADARVRAALEQEGTRQNNDRRVRAEINAADSARMTRMDLAIQARQSEEDVEPVPGPAATTPPMPKKSLLQRLGGKRKLRRDE